MEFLLWFVSSAVMAVLLLLLAFRALGELLGLRPQLSALAGRLTALRERIAVPLSPADWPWPVLFLASLALLWLGAFASCAAEHGLGDFPASFWARLTESGDAPHYLYIAQNGYASAGDAVNKIVFYPLYPLLIAGLGFVFGGNHALAGVVLSEVCYGLSVLVLRRLAKLDCAHPGAAILAYWFYPFGFFCLGVFTEGLFLLLTLLGLYLLRTRRWALAGLVGFFCALTRTQGVLLLLPAVYCAWQAVRETGWSWKMAALPGPALGFGLYLLLNRIVCGSFFAFRYYESIEPWWQTPQWLGDTVAQQWTMAHEHPGLADWIYWPQLFGYFLAAALLFYGFYTRLSTAHILYGTANLGMCYTASWLISGGRYLLGCVPLFLCVGQIRSRFGRAALLLTEFLLFWVFYRWFVQGQAIM